MSRLVVLSIATVTFAGLNLYLWAAAPIPAYGATARALTLLPQQIDGMKIVREWSQKLPTGTIENGANYGGDEPGRWIQLDFFRRASHVHNSAICYIDQGERLIWQSVQSLPFATTSAQVDLALLRLPGQLRLVASTQCGVNACVSRALPTWHGFAIDLLSGRTGPAMSAVVPVSLVVTADVAAGEDWSSVRSSLMARVRRAVVDVDLRPAQQLAALQWNTGRSVSGM